MRYLTLSCDGLERHCYRSTYVFVPRSARPLQGLTLDDVRLKSLSIGMQMVGDNAVNTRPVHGVGAGRFGIIPATDARRRHAKPKL